jgi:hypothetical protein
MARRNRRLATEDKRRKRVRDMSPWFDSQGDCPSGKLRYADELQASKALRSAQAKREKRGHYVVEKRWYQCGYCDGFHLTSKEFRDTWEMSQQRVDNTAVAM